MCMWSCRRRHETGSDDDDTENAVMVLLLDVESHNQLKLTPRLDALILFTIRSTKERNLSWGSSLEFVSK